MKVYKEDTDMPLYATTYESEGQTMGGISVLRDMTETGSDLFGLWTNGGRPIILLATAPGADAICTAVGFEQDIGFFCRTNQILTQRYGLQWIGTHHYHHVMSRTPSMFDVHQVQSVTHRNKSSRWCEIITTCANGDQLSQNGANFQREMTKGQDGKRIRINVYLYTNPQDGERIEVPLRVLPGPSPFRSRVLADGILKPSDIGDYGAHFPIDRIDYDSFDFEKTPSSLTDRLFQVLAEQCQELPEQMQRGVEFDVKENLVVVALRLPNDGMVHAGFRIKPPHLVQSVYVKNKGDREPADMTSALLADGADITLSGIYEKLLLRRLEKACSRLPLYELWTQIEALEECDEA